MFVCCIFKETTSEEEFRDMVRSSEYDFFTDCGVTKPAMMISITDKESIISAVCLHYAILGSLAELEQLKRGLQVANFSSLMEKYDLLFRHLFVHSKWPLYSQFHPRYVHCRFF